MNSDKTAGTEKSWKRPRENGSKASYDASEAQGRVHSLELEELIIHKVADPTAWLEGADCIARALLNRELREDEDFSRIKAGSYRIRLAHLTRDAGALRCSVLAGMVAREVRQLDSASADLDHDRSKADQRQSGSGLRRSFAIPTSSRPASSSQTLDPDEEEMRRNTSRAFERMASGPVPAEEAGLTSKDRVALDEVSLNFHPVWHAKNRMITAYHCRPSKKGRDLSSAELRALLSSTAEALVDAKIDAMVYEEAMKVVQWLIAQKLTALLILPIHFSTIARSRFLSAVIGSAATSLPAAANLIVLEIIDIPSDVTRMRLRDPVARLRGRARGLLARLDFEPFDLGIFKENGFHGVSVNLAAAKYDAAEIIKTFERFVVAAEKQRLQSFVQAISSNSQNVAALSAGFTYIDGPVISLPASHPSHIRPFDIDMLYGV